MMRMKMMTMFMLSWSKSESQSILTTALIILHFFLLNKYYINGLWWGFWTHYFVLAGVDTINLLKTAKFGCVRHLAPTVLKISLNFHQFGIGLAWPSLLSNIIR